MKIPLKIYGGALFIVTLLFSSCSEKSVTPAPVNPEIFPLKVGNTWIFQSIRSDSSKLIHYNKVIGDTVCYGQSWFKLTYDASVLTICRNDSQGWWFLYADNPLVSSISSLYYRYPARVNDQYMTSDSTLVTVLSLNERIIVPAGTFTCYHYHMVHYREHYVCEEFFSPGTGFIKHIVYEPGTGVETIYETTDLVSFHLQEQ